MQINDFNHVYAVTHDLLSERSSSFHQIDASTCNLQNNTNGKIVSPYLYGVFSDERENIFLAMRENINTYVFELQIGDNVFNINNVMYETVSDIIAKPPTSSLGFFKFMDSKPAAALGVDRCDAARNGPAVFLREGQKPLSVVVNTTRPFALSDLEEYCSLLSVDGVGHLIYVKYFKGHNDSNEEFETNESDLPTAARSLFPALKVLVEWAEMTKEPWNSNEPVALAASEFLTKIGMPEEIRRDIEDNNTDMHVYRYISGDNDARRQPPVEQISEMTAMTRRWVKSKMFYKNISHLYRNMFI
jgi:hypothetical protein